MRNPAPIAQLTAIEKYVKVLIPVVIFSTIFEKGNKIRLLRLKIKQLLLLITTPLTIAMVSTLYTSCKTHTVFLLTSRTRAVTSLWFLRFSKGVRVSLQDECAGLITFFIVFWCVVTVYACTIMTILVLIKTFTIKFKTFGFLTFSCSSLYRDQCRWGYLLWYWLCRECIPATYADVNVTHLLKIRW